MCGNNGLRAHAQHAKDEEMTKEELVAFEEEIAALFNAGKIRAPIHLYYGNEEAMIRVFRNIHPQDWVFCSWRSHYQCLLKGVPKDRVRDEILAGRSKIGRASCRERV